MVLSKDKDDNNKIVYVGIGTKDRAWYCRNRHEDHQEWLDEMYNKGYTMEDIVDLGDTFISRKEALEIELNLIDEHRPKFNRNYELNNVCKLTKESFDLAIELREEGLFYKDIANELGVSPMTIHRALSGGTKKYERFK